jgi:hypothetical protein
LLPPGDLVPDEDFSFLFFVAEDEDIRDRRVRREGDFSLTDVRALLSEGLGFAISDGGAARFLASHDEKKKLGADYFVSGGAGVSKKFWRPALSRRIKKKFGFGGRRCRGESKKKVWSTEGGESNKIFVSSFGCDSNFFFVGRRLPSDELFFDPAKRTRLSLFVSMDDDIHSEWCARGTLSLLGTCRQPPWCSKATHDR